MYNQIQNAGHGACYPILLPARAREAGFAPAMGTMPRQRIKPALGTDPGFEARSSVSGVHTALEMKTTIEDLICNLESQGLQGRVVSIKHTKDLQLQLDRQYTQGLLAEEFYQERLQFYQFTPPGDMPIAESLIIVAVPRPQTPVIFNLNGEKHMLVLPPTYAGYEYIYRQVGAHLASILAPDGYSVSPARLPLKLLAACSGLTEYGRNNVTYIPGMGSFFQLTAYYSNIPAPDKPWQEPRMLERCNTCRACLIKCPTGAISDDRFLLHAERCLVFHNERPATHPFPSWIEPGVHHCLMGCMVCQQFCPEDKPFLGWFEAEVGFSEDETRLLLKGATHNQLPTETLKKLEQLELLGDLDKLPRNLSVLLAPST